MRYGICLLVLFVASGAVKAQAVYSYKGGQERSVERGQAHIIFVGTKAREIQGCVVSQATVLDGYVSPCVIVAVPENGQTWFQAQLPARAGDREILAARSAVSRPAIPFSQIQSLPRPLDLLARPDVVDEHGHGSWPELPSWMKPYQRSTVTANGTPISFIPDDWHQPGGLKGVKGWESKLYKWIAGGWTDGSGPVKTREYADGTIFVDRLFHNGVEFERRQREKVVGRWESSRMIRVSARPPGYRAVGEGACASCHKFAGIGAQGGDGVFSDPWP